MLEMFHNHVDQIATGVLRRKIVKKQGCLRGVLVWVGVFLGFAFFVPQQGVAVSLSQTEFSFNAPQGGEVSGSFRVQNNENASVNVFLGLVDWQRGPQGQLVFGQAGTHERSSANWITVLPQQFDLLVGEDQVVTFTLSVPQENVGGTYWTGLALVITPINTKSSSSSVEVQTNLFVKIIETVSGSSLDKNGQLRAVRHLGFNPFVAEVEFLNTGNVLLKDVRGRVEIRNIQGKTIRSLPIENFDVLPGDLRRVRAFDRTEGHQVLPPGKYIALVILDFGGAFQLGGQLVFSIDGLNLTPLPDSQGIAQDLDGNGLFEDVNGDGQLNALDADMLETNLASTDVQRNWRAFDFNNDGQLDQADVSALRALAGQR